MVFAVVLIALCLAVHRTTRLLTKDEIPLIRVPRDMLVNWLDPRYGLGDPAEGQPAPHSKAALIATPLAFLLAALAAAIALAVGYQPPWLLIATIAVGVVAFLAIAFKEQAARSVAYLIECPVCTSVYVAAGFSWAGASWLHLEGLAGHPLTWVAVALAASSVTVLLAGYEERQEQRYKIDQHKLEMLSDEHSKTPATGRMPR